MSWEAKVREVGAWVLAGPHVMTKPWRHRQALKAHGERMREARGTMDAILLPGHISARAGDAEREAEALALADNLNGLLREIEGASNPGAHVMDAGIELARAVSRLDAALNAARTFWPRGMLYESANLSGQATALLALDREARARGRKAGVKSQREAAERGGQLTAAMEAKLNEHPNVSSAALARMVGHPDADRWARKVKARRKAGTQQT